MTKVHDRVGDKWSRRQRHKLMGMHPAITDGFGCFRQPCVLFLKKKPFYEYPLNMLPVASRLHCCFLLASWSHSRLEYLFAVLFRWWWNIGHFLSHMENSCLLLEDCCNQEQIQQCSLSPLTLRQVVTHPLQHRRKLVHVELCIKPH